MQVLKILCFITAAIIALFHFGSSFSKGKTAKMLAYTNLCLHLMLFFELMALKVSLELLALAFMISLFLKLLFSFAFYKLRVKGDEGE